MFLYVVGPLCNLIGITLARSSTVLCMIIWRYLGVLYSKNIDKESIIAKKINSIAYGMTTAIVFKIVFFPDNALNLIPDTDRIIPFFIGIIVFLVFSKNTSFGLITGISSFSFLILYFIQTNPTFSLV